MDLKGKKVIVHDMCLRDGMHPKRHRMQMNYKLACDEKGKLTALRARIVGDTGAYASVGGEVVARTGTHAAAAYHVPSVDVVASAYYTNNPPAGAFRGFGVNQSNFAMESLVDELCIKGGFDHWQFRYNNILTAGRVTTTGQVLGEGVGLRQCLEAVKDAFCQADYAACLPRGPVDHQRAAGIAEIQFPCQGGLRHARHAYNIAAVPFQAFNFPGRFQTRPLGGSVGGLVDDLEPIGGQIEGGNRIHRIVLADMPWPDHHAEPRRQPLTE